MFWVFIKKWFFRGLLAGFDELKPIVASVIRAEQAKAIALNPDTLSASIVDTVEVWILKKLGVQKEPEGVPPVV